MVVRIFVHRPPGSASPDTYRLYDANKQYDQRADPRSGSADSHGLTYFVIATVPLSTKLTLERTNGGAVISEFEDKDARQLLKEASATPSLGKKHEFGFEDDLAFLDYPSEKVLM